MYDEKVTMLSKRNIESLPKALRIPIDYRKSGLSLNHIIGCPMKCAYCVRHLFGVYSMDKPCSIMSDEEAVNLLINHKYFQPDVTPLQIFNRATDPFLLGVKEHMYKVLKILDEMKLGNIVIIITRYRITDEDCNMLNNIKNLKVSICITHSGINDNRIENINIRIPIESLKRAYKNANNYRVILYWRPLIQGLNDTKAHLTVAANLSRFAHATVFSGIFYKGKIKNYLNDNKLPIIYNNSARRKILPYEVEKRIIDTFTYNKDMSIGKIFRKTSCAIAYSFKIADYNAHYCIEEICDICPQDQQHICDNAYKKPDCYVVSSLLNKIRKHDTAFQISDKAVIIDLGDQDRHYLQHSLPFQIHNPRFPHKKRRHGRADIGWESLEE